MNADAREEQARREVGETRISRGTATVLIAGFLLVVFGVPVAQLISDFRRDPGLPRERLELLVGIPAAFLRPGPPPPADAVFQDGPIASTLSRNRAAIAAMKRFETRLEEDSVIRDAVVPAFQSFLFRALGWGGESVVADGSDGLLLREDIDYLLSPDSEGFVASRTAVLDFAAALRARGISLIMVPVPVKASFAVGQFGIPASHPPIFHPSYSGWRETIEAAGVPVVAAGGVLRSFGSRAFLRTDTHWTPEAMIAVAAESAAVVSRDPGLASSSDYPVGYEVATHRGDLAGLILPRGVPDSIDRETVTLRVPVLSEVEEGRGRPRVVVLGDSFTNIFRLERMGWGANAGFAEHLAAALPGIPVEVFAQNGDGAFASRERFAAAWARDPERFQDLALVVWQFSRRELISGDWGRGALPPAEISER